LTDEHPEHEATCSLGTITSWVGRQHPLGGEFPEAAAGRFLSTPTVNHNSWLDRALVRAELPPITIHDLRHTAASLTVASGANMKAVQKMLGHASAAITFDIYTDLFEDDLDAVAQRLDEAATRSDVVKIWSNGAAGARASRPRAATSA
jgi:integrase